MIKPNVTFMANEVCIFKGDFFDDKKRCERLNKIGKPNPPKIIRAEMVNIMGQLNWKSIRLFEYKLNPALQNAETE